MNGRPVRPAGGTAGAGAGAGSAAPAAPPGLESTRAVAAALVDAVRVAYRRRGATRAAVRAVGWGAAAAAALLILDAAAGLSRSLLPILAAAPLFAFLYFAGEGLARAVRPRPRAAFARLAEERAALGQRLTTALSARADSPLAAAFAAEAGPRLAAVRADDVAPWRVRRPALASAAALAVLAALVSAAGGPGAVLERWSGAGGEAPASPSAGRAAAGAAAGSRPAIGEVRWRATPPAYAGTGTAQGDGSVPVRALAGSVVDVAVDVRGDAELSARVIGGAGIDRGPAGADEGTAGAATERFAWRLAPADRALELELRSADRVLERRLLPLLPVPDSAPRVTLEAPDRDMTLAEGRGTLDVRARARDDLAVAAFELRWIRSRGGGESYAFDEGVLPWTRVVGPARERSASASVDLGGLDLGPGDVLHLRAVARDGNAISGPGEGTSETRTLRIARADEEALVDAVLTLPAEAGANPILSQRMLIVLTERLIERRPPPEELAREAREIAEEQARLRGRVGEIIFSRVGDGSEEAGGDPFASPEDVFGGDPADSEHDDEGDAPDPLDPEDVLEAASRATGTGDPEETAHRHDESAILSINRDLLGAYNEMWDAERELRQAAAAASLPPQNRALDLLQKIRAGERVFARGRVTVPPVDVAAARGTGDLEGVRPGARAGGNGGDRAPSLAAAIETAIRAWPALPPERASLRASALAAELFADPGIDARAGALASRAADAARAGEGARGRRLLGEALRVLAPAPRAGAAPAPPAGAAPAYHDALAASGTGAAPSSEGARVEPFVFATARYASGDWDSAPLVPANITHSVAQYTEIPVDPEPVAVDLSSGEVFGYPFLFLTGHLPVHFTSAESANLKAWVERGGLLFIDDHNHDIDAAFHRTVVAELERLFGPGALVELPGDHELYRTFFTFPDGPPTTAHELNGWGDGLVHEALQAVFVGGRIGVLYSNKDYASQWNYHAANKRFNAIDDTRFGVNVIVYALTR